MPVQMDGMTRALVLHHQRRGQSFLRPAPFMRCLCGPEGIQRNGQKSKKKNQVSRDGPSFYLWLSDDLHTGSAAYPLIFNRLASWALFFYHFRLRSFFASLFISPVYRKSHFFLLPKPQEPTSVPSHHSRMIFSFTMGHLSIERPITAPLAPCSRANKADGQTDGRTACNSGRHMVEITE